MNPDLKETQIPSEEQKIVLRTLAQSVARPRCRFLEVGSWCGDSAVVLGNVAKSQNGHLFCVDWWKGNPGTELAEIASKNDIYSHFWQRMVREGLGDVVIPLRGSSGIISEILREHTFDLVFIDGDHRYDAVFKDMLQYRTFVKRDKGILCGDDCEGKSPDFDKDFLEAGKNLDVYESVHCGVVLAVGSVFKDYAVNYSIWSVEAQWMVGWKKTEVSFPGIPEKRQLQPPPIGVTDSFCLYRYGRRVYAVPKSLLDFDLDSMIEGERKDLISARSVKQIEQITGEVLCSKTAPFLSGSHKGWNIVQYDGSFYAVSQALGAVDLSRGEERNRAEVLQGNSPDEIEAMIEQRLAQEKIPILLDAYQGYNLVQFGPQTYAISQAVGPFELRSEKDQKRLLPYLKSGQCMIGRSVEEVKRHVDATLSENPQALA